MKWRVVAVLVIVAALHVVGDPACPEDCTDGSKVATCGSLGRTRSCIEYLNGTVVMQCVRPCYAYRLGVEGCTKDLDCSWWYLFGDFFLNLFGEIESFFNGLGKGARYVVSTLLLAAGASLTFLGGRTPIASCALTGFVLGCMLGQAGARASGVTTDAKDTFRLGLSTAAVGCVVTVAFVALPRVATAAMGAQLGVILPWLIIGVAVPDESWGRDSNRLIVQAVVCSLCAAGGAFAAHRYPKMGVVIYTTVLGSVCFSHGIVYFAFSKTLSSCWSQPAPAAVAGCFLAIGIAVGLYVQTNTVDTTKDSHQAYAYRVLENATATAHSPPQRASPPVPSAPPAPPEVMINTSSTDRQPVENLSFSPYDAAS
eukprot:Sspe_Gene.118130::Locus_110920_Transcript_1_1_Confidence_1.000_Length_1461::g.118130::m.118130